MILLDTNVLSELVRPRPEIRVATWLASLEASELFVTAITEAELRYGVSLLPRGQRREALETALNDLLREEFSGRILAFDSAAAVAYARVAARRRALGRPISQFDAQIAAIADVAGASLATRNIADFEDCGIPLIDPWRV